MRYTTFGHRTGLRVSEYALGTANQNLPSFVNIGRPSSPVQLTGGYLGATVSATPFQAGETPIPNLYPPKSSSSAEREHQMQALHELNREFREDEDELRAFAANDPVVTTGTAQIEVGKLLAGFVRPR